MREREREWERENKKHMSKYSTIVYQVRENFSDRNSQCQFATADHKVEIIRTRQYLFSIVQSYSYLQELIRIHPYIVCRERDYTHICVCACDVHTQISKAEMLCDTKSIV